MSIDVIGTLYNNDAVIDDKGNIATPATQADGFHINSTRKIAGLDAYIVSPSTPRRVFAGVPTICYTFADEDEAKTLIGWSEDDGYTPAFEPLPDPVPGYVTKRQGRQQLILIGLIDTVQPAIDAITDSTQRALVQSFWDDSSIYERNHPQMITLAHAIGMNDEQLDKAFIEAEKL